LGIKRFGLGVEDEGIEIWVSRVRGLEFRVVHIVAKGWLGSGFRVQGTGYRVQGTGLYI
jgi:hypothetical protein